MEKLSTDDPRYQNAAQIADALLSGQMPDPTAGATHFLNPTVVWQGRGGSLP
jgi:spore germination cell wall hydrolase CwlJ-like protein